MKIAIATSGRFHLLDLARELAARGYEVEFYSFIPKSRCEEFGLDRKYVKGFFPVCAAIEFLCRRLHLKGSLLRHIRDLNDSLLDQTVAWRLRRCDVFISISGVYVKALKAARRKYGATLLVERGCKHILAQHEILTKVPGAKAPSPRDIRRELTGYELADRVVIASQHVKESFLEYGYQEEKLFINPYGVSLSQFAPTDKPGPDAYDVIMVGGWMYRKGCDLLARACVDILGIKLLHVGALVDCPAPDSPLFTHVDPVPQSRLMEYYSQAKVFALPSREDGFGMVLIQALACGLPIVCSKDTGGSELAKFLDDKRWIIEMPETTAESIAASLRRALELAASQPEGRRDYAGDSVKELTWEAYGKRYGDFLQTIGK